MKETDNIIIQLTSEQRHILTESIQCLLDSIKLAEYLPKKFIMTQDQKDKLKEKQSQAEDLKYQIQIKGEKIS